MIEVKIHGSFAEHGGYGKVNRNLAKGLSDLGVAVYLDPIKKNELAGGIIASSPINKQVSKNAISIDSIVPTIGMESFGRYRILYTTIESRTIPQSFVDQANTYNEVWVTSDFCAGVLKNHGCKKTIFVLPDSINIDMYNIDGDIHDFMPQLKQFVFISVMGWNYRKGYDVLLKAYLSTFTGDSDVSLLLLTRHFSKQQEPIKKAIDEFIKSYGGDNPPHIVRCHKIIPEAEMPSWYRAADAFVLFSRGEGFCLTAAEASLCGCPVISTNYSGQTMFLNNTNSYLLRIDRFSKTPPGLMYAHYWDDQEFPSLTSPASIKEAGGLLKTVAGDNKERTTRNNRLRKELQTNYSIKAISQKAKDRLEKIWSKL